ncbi:uncharacterized protein N7483_005865 [Penicillium malachiteum]|uniref:uncharacterized protein n=1 Tax=Penicillium malachiteum TaxID=1324776 RepID=UPI002548F587|nr:uncharacterized protein N7483_005865 [Penicillium malachiteum]KAJ5731357.1 hypothetical protein N7483_005865 [Penicillium malachiteum]
MNGQPKIELLQAEVDCDGDDQSFFRLLIEDRYIKYLTIDTGIYSTDDMCFGPSLASLLPVLPPGDWNDGLVSKNKEGQPYFASMKMTQFPGIPNIWHKNFIDYSELSIGEKLRTGIYEVEYKSQIPNRTIVAKFARFPWEIQYLENETKAYQWISGLNIGPGFIGHLTENGRVIGFLMERIFNARHATCGAQDLEACKEHTMARAAVLPQSPAKWARTATKSTMNKATKTKTAEPKKRAPVRSTSTATREDMGSDTDDELGMMMEETKKVAPPRSRATGRPVTKPTVPRGRKPTTTPAINKSQGDREAIQETQSEAPKKRVGRPRKNQEAESATKPTATSKARGRPKVETSKTNLATRKIARNATDNDSSTESAAPKNIVISTNSTIVRSNILRGPAKKKTVTFQNVSDQESEGETEESVAPAAGGRRAGRQGGLRSTPVRKRIVTTRGSKTTTAKSATKPLSPKKAKQVAKSLSAYASSDGEEDELSGAMNEMKGAVKLVVHSPTKQSSDSVGLSSPVRRINFTPKKSVDENGEPKLPTPKHGSTVTGLSSPVRKINFTPNRSQQTAADNGHLALPAGKTIDFSDSVFMSSPAKRPEQSSPFRFSFRDTPNGSSLFRDELNAAPALNLSHAPSSPLKMSPRKGHLGASFSQSPSKAEAPIFSARSSLIQSPAKRIASPFKNSLFSAKSINQAAAPIDESTGGLFGSNSLNRRLSSHQESEENEALDEDLEMVEEVARDIFGIELQSSKTSTPSPSSQEVLEDPEPVETRMEEAHCADISEAEETEETEEEEMEERDVDQEIQDLEEIRHEQDDFGTICFNTMEELQRPFKNLPAEEDIESEMDFDDADSIGQADESDQEEAGDDFAVESIEPAEIESIEPEHAEAVTELGYSSPAPQSVHSSVHVTPVSESPLNMDLLEEYAVQEPESPTPVRNLRSTILIGDMEMREDDDLSETGSIIYQPFEEQEAEIEEDDVMHDVPSAIPSDATFTALPQPRSPDEVNSGESSPLQRMGPIPSLVPTPPAGKATMAMMDSAQSHSRLFDIENTEERFGAVDSPMETTQTDIPTPTMRRLSGTPGTRNRRGSGFNVKLGFTPLASQFGHWEANTPTRERPLRPHEGDVSYPDLSRTSLANTPHLFCELPLHSYNDDTAMTPASGSKYKSAHNDHDMTSSPSRSDIFEDLQPVVPAHLRASLPHQPTADEEGDSSSEDKENLPAPTPLPATPMKAVPEHLRTVHTVSKVPLKGEGETSPLKMPRKRGHSVSNTSPTRSSSRLRNSILLPRTDSAPAISPRADGQSPRSPSPKRRRSAARLSSVRMTSMPPPKSPAVASSPGKTPRRNPSPKKQALRGAVVYVDVHTTEGEDASGIFIELLQQMGARCFKSWSWNPRASMSPVDGVDPAHTIGKVGITHVVYKDGGLRTLEKVKSAAGLVKCVGVGWVLDCERENKWLDEAPYVIDSSIIPRGGAKRRKSMEPRALSNINGTLKRIAEPSTPSASGRRCGADRNAIEGFRKITPPTPLGASPSTPRGQTSTDRYQIPQTPGYNFANLDAIGMSPATPYFLSNRTQLVQQSCPPKAERTRLVLWREEANIELR